MRTLTRSIFALTALAAGCSSAATPTPEPEGEPSARPASSASSASSPSSDGTSSSAQGLTQTEWRRLMSKTPTPKAGCFRGSPHGTKWEEVPCANAPTAPRPLPKRLLSRFQLATALGTTAPGATGSGVGRLAPYVVGGSGPDDNAQVAGLLNWAEGSFPFEVGGANESDNQSAASHGGANSYSLQMNTNLFNSAPCNSSTNFSCQGWEQLVYDPQEQQAYFEFSLINYAGNCPAPFTSSYVVPGSNPPIPVCYFNSSSVVVPGQPASNLGNMAMVGTTSGGNDTLVMFVNGTSYAVAQPSVLGLANGWNDVEFNVFGEDNGTQASFNSPTSLEVQIVTQTTTSSRAAPTCPSAGTTGESNTLNLVGSCCAFGGDLPGIQFLESNIPGAAAPTCPTLTVTPSPVSIPSGAQGYTTLSVVGNLVGQSSNAALQPKSCTVNGQAQAWQNTSVQGQEWFFTVPASAPPGSTLTDTATCDTGQQVSIPISAANPIFTASPNPLVVAQGSCGTFQASMSPSSGVPALTINVTQNHLPAAANLSPLGTTVNNSASFSVCPSLSAPPGSYGLTLTSSGNVPQETNTTNMLVDITACQPIPQSQACTSGSYAACGQRSGGCGVEYNCAPCNAGTSCSNGVCCPGGMVGSDGTCCPNGEVYYAGLGCMAPCPTGTIPCPIGGGCMTETACNLANNGPQPPNCARNHTCM